MNRVHLLNTIVFLVQGKKDFNWKYNDEKMYSH